MKNNYRKSNGKGKIQNVSNEHLVKDTSQSLNIQNPYYGEEIDLDSKIKRSNPTRSQTTEVANVLVVQNPYYE